MKLLMTTDTLGGVWTYALELIDALRPHGVIVTLATMGAPLTDDQCKQVSRLSNVEVVSSSYRLEWMHDAWDDVDDAGAWLKDLAEQVSPDCVHLNGYSHAALDWDVPVVVVAHSCVLSWWQAVRGVLGPQAELEWATYRRRVSQGLACADAIVAPTHAMARCINDLYRPPHEIQVIANGRSALRFVPAPKHPYVFAAGRMWDQAKNLATLDAAAADLPWRVYVAGPLCEPGASVSHTLAQDDSHQPRLNQSVSQNVRELGPLPAHELRGWLANADIYALPARYEPFGLSGLEAALCGCTLLLGDIPSLREVWGEAAMFVEPNDADAVHSALRHLIRSPRLRQTLSAKARARALELTPQAMAERYMQLYQQLLHPLLRREDVPVAPSRLLTAAVGIAQPQP
jgi:glycogen(starch) synthase